MCPVSPSASCRLYPCRKHRQHGWAGNQHHPALLRPLTRCQCPSLAPRRLIPAHTSFLFSHLPPAPSNSGACLKRCREQTPQGQGWAGLTIPSKKSVHRNGCSPGSMVGLGAEKELPQPPVCRHIDLRHYSSSVEDQALTSEQNTGDWKTTPQCVTQLLLTVCSHTGSLTHSKAGGRPRPAPKYSLRHREGSTLPSLVFYHDMEKSH